MKTIIVRKHKFVLWLGLFILLFWGFLFLVMLLDDIGSQPLGLLILYTVLLGGFGFLGFYLIIMYFRNRFLIADYTITYSSALGRKRSFNYSDIAAVHLYTYDRSQISNHHVLISRSGERLAVLDPRMVNSEHIIKALRKRDVPFKEAPTSTAAPNFKSLEKAHKAERAYIEERYSLSRISRLRKPYRILGGILAIIVIATLFLPFIPTKIRIIIWLVVIYTSWILYIWFYPRMVFELPKTNKEKTFYLSLPMWGSIIALIFSLILSQMLNMRDSELFTFTACYAIILMIPLLIVAVVRKAFHRWHRLLLACLCAFYVAFSTTPAINLLATVENTRHIPVIVTDKDTSRSRYITNYYLTVDTDVYDEHLNVSSSLYDDTDIGDVLCLGVFESIFGYHCYSLHK